MKIYCDQCQCWGESIHNRDYGECHLNPPIVYIKDKYLNTETLFPRTHYRTFCFKGVLK